MLAREYLWRYLTVVVVAILVCVIFLAVFLVPSYIFSKEKYDELAVEQKSLESSPLFAEQTGLLATLKSVKDETALGKTPDTFPTKVIEDIIGHEPTTISIINFQYVYDPTSSKLVVSGTALNRDALTGFAATLSADTLLSSVSYPISDLSANHDIAFTITINGHF